MLRGSTKRIPKPRIPRQRSKFFFAEKEGIMWGIIRCQNGNQKLEVKIWDPDQNGFELTNLVNRLKKVYRSVEVVKF
jgi:hypothetical protein